MSIESAHEFSASDYVRGLIVRAANGNEHAEAFLERLLALVKTVDDLQDKDNFVSDEDRNKVFFDLISGWESNPYCQQWHFGIQALLTVSYNAWLDSVEMKSRGPDMQKYGRALSCWVFDLIPFVAYTTGGYELMRQVSMDTRNLVVAYGEMNLRV